VLFPHFGHAILVVGKVRIWCSFPITVTDSLGERFMGLAAASALCLPGFLYPHFGHTI